MAEQRSKKYPSINLGEAIKKLDELVTNAGSSSDYSRETFASALGYKSAANGAFLRTSAALIQYGLIHREGKNFSLSKLSRTIIFPTEELDKPTAIKNAALNPPVFKSIYEDFKGQPLPLLLPNMLVQNYGILPGAKDKVVSIFKSTMLYASLLQNDILIQSPFITSEDITESENSIESLESSADETKQEIASSLSSSVPFTSFTKDFGEGRIAVLKIPTDLDDDEREKLASLIKNM